MGIRLKEAMKIDPFSRTTLLGGCKGIDRMVVATNIQEVPNVDRWLYGGEILFTSGYAFGSIDNACALMRRINSKGVAAMVVKPGQYLKEVPQKMIDCADEINLPLFEMPENLPYMDCIVPIEARIVNEHAFVLERTELTHDKLLQQIVEGKGLNGICSILYQVAVRPVVIMDVEGTVLAAEVGKEEKDVYLKELSSDFRAYYKKHGNKRLILNKYNRVSINNDYYMICVPVSIEMETLAYMLVDSNYEELQNSDLLIFQNASALIAVQILQERALLKKEADMSAQLLDDILTRKYSDFSIIQRRCKYAGFDSSHNYCICVLSADSFESWMQKDVNTMINEAVIQKIKQSVSSIVQEEFHKGNKKILGMVEGIGMVVMVSINDSTDIIQCSDIIKNAIMRLLKTYPKLSFSAGISRIKSTIEEASDSLREAKLARKAGKTIYDDKKPTVALFDSLSSLCFLNELSGSEEMRRFYEENVGKIIEYDEKNKTELMSTLDCYFRNGRNLRLTSEELFIHKNSVVYRIKKVEEVINRSLSDYETLFNLMLCMKIRFLI